MFTRYRGFVLQETRLLTRTFATPAKPASPAGAPAAAGGGAKAPAKGAASAKGGAKKKGGKESKMGNTLTAGSTGFAVGEKIPIGIMKEGQDPIVKSDKDYPTWLWKVHDMPTLTDCLRTLAKDAEEGKPPNVELVNRVNRLRRKVSFVSDPAVLSTNSLILRTASRRSTRISCKGDCRRHPVCSLMILYVHSGRSSIAS